MISCLVGYIGLKTIADSPTSGIFLNELPGITTEQFDLSRSQEIAAIAKEWESLENKAIRNFESDLKYHLRKYFKNHSVITSNTTGYINEKVLVGHGNVYSGVLIDLYNQSPNLKVSIENVKINLVSADTFNVKIFDANLGTELFTKEVDGVAGLNTVKINKEFAVYDYNRIFVAYDTVTPYRMYDILAPWSVGSYSVLTTSQVIIGNLNPEATGLSVNYSVKCGIDEFVCNRLSLFQESFIYRLGLEFLRTSKYSDRINRYTLLGKERRDDMMADFTEQYKESIEAAFQDLKVDDDGICFICNKAITKKVLIP